MDRLGGVKRDPDGREEPNRAVGERVGDDGECGWELVCVSLRVCVVIEV